MGRRRMSFVGVTNYKKTSERLPGKHHNEFYDGKSLIDVKLEQLFAAGAEHVYISTDDTEVSNSENITYVQRDAEYCNNVTRFGYVLEKIYHDVPVADDQNVIYTFVCCPLFKRYDQMYREYLRSGQNQIAVHNSTHYYMDVNKRPINFNFGLWHPYSQGIDPVYMFPYAGTVCKMRDLREANYMIPLEFEYFNMNQFEAIDIDEQEEFELAQVLYNHYK
jgi:CMP-N-acetylneuraminic acid synthetase